VDKVKKKSKFLALFTIMLVPLSISPVLSHPKFSYVNDPRNDWTVNVSAKGYSDIIFAKVETVLTGYFESKQILFTMVLASHIPLTTTEQYVSYVWSIDLNGDGQFNTPGDMNARVAYDGDVTHTDNYGWHAYLDGNYYTGIMFTFTIKGNTVTFTFPLSYLHNPTSFKWMGSSIEVNLGGTNSDETSKATWGS
jgi:hypothetical protein